MTPLLALFLVTVLRLGIAAALPLSADEAYYWVWSRALAPGYLDHPPMVAVWIWAGTLLAGDSAIGVRLLAPLSAAAGSVLLADTANRLFPNWPSGRSLGVTASVLLNATLLAGAGAVTMTPDTPLLFFWTLAMWAMARSLSGGAWWLVVGMAAGLALDSKYTGALLGVGIVLWLAWVPGLRRQLLNPLLWAGGAMAVLLFAPVVGWNALHGWASFVKQGGRAGDWRPEAALRYLGELLAGQAALATPLLFALCAGGMWTAWRRAVSRDPAFSLLAALTLPGALLFIQHALGDRVQANWVGILYPAASIAAAWLDWRWWRWAAGLGFAITGLAYLQGVAAPFPLPRALDPTLIRLGGWDTLAAQADQLRRRQGADFLASENYGQASLLAWWAPPGTQVVGAEQRWAFTNLPAAPGGTGLLLISQRRAEPPDPRVWQGAEQVGQLVRSRAGVEAEAFRVYRVTSRPGATSVTLPRPAGQ